MTPTSVCIHVLNERHQGLLQRFREALPAEIALCSLVKAELFYGARRSQRVEENLRCLDRFFEPLCSLPFDDRCAQEYGRIRADLAEQGRPIGPNDLMIAAIACAYDATLVTHNTNEFGRITGLRLQDWEAD